MILLVVCVEWRQFTSRVFGYGQGNGYNPNMPPISIYYFSAGIVARDKSSLAQRGSNCNSTVQGFCWPLFSVIFSNFCIQTKSVALSYYIELLLSLVIGVTMLVRLCVVKFFHVI